MHEKDVDWKEQYKVLWTETSQNHQELIAITHELRVLTQRLEQLQADLDPYQGLVTLLDDGELVVRAL